MFLNQLQQLGAPNHEAVPARWQELLAEINVERIRRHHPPLEFSYNAEAVAAYVNYGRWVADCPHCNGGIAVSPGFPYCCCLDCGRVYVPIVPDDIQITAAEALLDRRAPQNRHWYPADEPIRLLQAENEKHGLDDSVDADQPYNTVEFLLPAELELAGELHIGNLNLPLNPGRTN